MPLKPPRIKLASIVYPLLYSLTSATRPFARYDDDDDDCIYTQVNSSKILKFQVIYIYSCVCFLNRDESLYINECMCMCGKVCLSDFLYKAIEFLDSTNFSTTLGHFYFYFILVFFIFSFSSIKGSLQTCILNVLHQLCPSRSLSVLQRTQRPLFFAFISHSLDV